MQLDDILLQPGLETQKYASIILPKITICGHLLKQHTVFVSRFDDSWGIDALIGLDFFRMYNVEIDYSQGVVVSTKL